MAASTPKTFDSKVVRAGSFKCDFSQSQIKDEPMFFNSSLPFAMLNGGPITRAFIQSLPDGWTNCVFDSRIHMLMPGWYPAIPGWHHDDVPRAPLPPGTHFMMGGQPDYDNPRYKAEHIMALVNGEICPTQFIVGECKMSAVPEGLIYRKWSEEINGMLATGANVDVVQCESGILYAFDWQAFHTGVKAVGNGWRWFGRVSRNTDRVGSITNEIRKQVQVYLEFPMDGW